MKVMNMMSNNGAKVPNQFIIKDDFGNTYFQSYDSIIARISSSGKVELDKDTWECSKTTGKYRNRFLGETKKETEKKIQAGVYILTRLN